MSRATGRSAVAAAAYRAGEKLVDERTGEVHDYERRKGVLHSEIILPDGGTMARGELWNLAEAAEKRKDSKVAREIVVALPCELSQDQQIALVLDYAKGLSARTGWAIDVAVHAPGREGDQRNTHAHLLCSTRTIQREASGVPAMGSKTRDWDCSSFSTILVASERSEWGRVVNQVLEREGHESRVDSRSYKEQGFELLPQKHLGVHVNAMERRGVKTERGDYNREVQLHNAEIIELAKVRQAREEEQVWQKRLEGFSQLPYKELEQALFELHPGSVTSLAMESPSVQAASKALNEARDVCQQWKTAIDGELIALSQAERSWERIKQESPNKAFLADQGFWPNSSMRDTLNRIDNGKEWLDKALPAVLPVENKAFLAEKDYADALQQAIRSLEPEYEKQMSRYNEAYPILLKAQARELDKELMALEKAPYGEMRSTVEKVKWRYTEQAFWNKEPGEIKLSSKLERFPSASGKSRDVSIAKSALDDAERDKSAWLSEHPVKQFLHTQGVSQSKELRLLEGLIAFREKHLDRMQLSDGFYQECQRRFKEEHSLNHTRAFQQVQQAYGLEKQFVERAQHLMAERQRLEPEQHLAWEKQQGQARGMER